jgi:uncharacterized protein (DUF305 family)
MKKMLRLAALLTTAALILTGCGNDQPETAGSRPFNDADVTFATEMIQHHAGALQMVDMTMGRDLDPKVAALAEEIRAAQAPEIETMTDWLQDWDQPIPETVRDHANAHGEGMEMDPDMPGMMTSEELEALEKAQGDAFETMWLQAMIEHHQGAVEMANTEQEQGQFPPAIDLAEQIETGQQREIATMENLLRS